MRHMADAPQERRVTLGLWCAVAAAGMYGGYFGAAQGVLLLALMGILLDSNLQRVNGIKNVLAFLVNGTAAVIFIAFAHVNWAVAACIAVGSTVGGFLGSAVGRRLPQTVLRVIIVVVGIVAIIKLVA
jgi:hypothetical protein